MSFLKKSHRCGCGAGNALPERNRKTRDRNAADPDDRLQWKVLADAAPAEADLKQMFVYNELFGAARSVLVYPAVSQGAHRLDGEYLDREHGCGTVEVGLFEGAELGSAALVSQVTRLFGTLREFAPVATVL